MMWTTQPRSKVGSLSAITCGTDQSAGPSVVLIHGVGLRAEAWGAQIAELSRTCRVIAVDMPGHGDSPALPSLPKMEDFCEQIADALDTPAVIIGHSFGAMIALDMAIRHPNLVKGVAALNAIFRRDPEAQAAVMARADSLDGVSVADPTGPLDRWFGVGASPERQACEGWLRAANPEGYRDAYRIFALQDGPSDADMARISCPALFLTGAEEPNSTPAMSHNMAALVPDGRAEIIEGAAHMMPMTHASRVNGILTDFIMGAS